MDFLKDNFKAIVLVLYLIWRILVGIRPEVSKEVDTYMRKFGGYKELLKLIAESEAQCEKSGVEKRDWVSNEIQKIFFSMTGEDMPINLANLITELVLAKYKKIFGG